MNVADKYKSQKDYYANHKESVRARYRTYYQDNKDYIKQLSCEYRQSFVGRFNLWKRQAKRRNIEWHLTLSFLEQLPMVCAYTGEILTLQAHKHNTLSLDRQDSFKGYTEDNVVFCCSTINLMKRDLSVEDFIEWCGKVRTNNN